MASLAALGLLLRARRDSASGIFQRRVRRVREVLIVRFAAIL